MGNVFHNSEVELVFGDLGVVVEYSLAFLRRTDSGNDGVAALEEYIEDVSSDEAGTTFNYIS